MLTLSKKVEYALIALLHMAGKTSYDLTTAKEMADQFSIPAELLGKVLQALVRSSKLVASTARRPRRLPPGPRAGRASTLGEVIEAVEGPVFLTKCQEDPAQCGQFHACTIKEPVQLLQEQLQQYIHSISLGAFRKTVRAPPTGGAPVMSDETRPPAGSRARSRAACGPPSPCAMCCAT
jgi:DNA-binding IscR family transcriptional regulator